MFRYLSALFSGILFGLGLVVSQMVNPAKVIGFLDLFGQWDPSLAFVMGGALIVTAIGYRFVTKNAQPLFEEQFRIPTNRAIDARLAIGSVLFGAGWGMVGLCPGPAVSALTIGGLPVVVFLASMGVGFLLFEKLYGGVQPTSGSSTGKNSAQSA
ncbi:MAG: YeeE/YedE family protein [Granulosicoccus sp.]|nr:YeeE/YedE family protein [Granulosicoccus sp.]